MYFMKPSVLRIKEFKHHSQFILIFYKMYPEINKYSNIL